MLCRRSYIRPPVAAVPRFSCRSQSPGVDARGHQADVRLDQAGDVAQGLAEVGVRVDRATGRGVLVGGEPAGGGDRVGELGGGRAQGGGGVGVQRLHGGGDGAGGRVVVAELEAVDGDQAQVGGRAGEGAGRHRVADRHRVERVRRAVHPEQPVEPAGAQGRAGGGSFEFLHGGEVGTVRGGHADGVHGGEPASVPVHPQRFQGRAQAEHRRAGDQPGPGYADAGTGPVVVRVAGRYDRGQAVEAAAQRQHDEHVPGVPGGTERHPGGELVTDQAGERARPTGGEDRTSGAAVHEVTGPRSRGS
jgi:hypothetical protein